MRTHSIQISEKFEKLRDEKALLIVAGKQDAAFYRIEDGRIEKIDAFKIPTPKYSDREGFTLVRGRGMTLGSGWPRELRDEDTIRSFIQEFKKRIKSLPNGWEKLYLFVPNQTKNEVKEALPRPFSERIEREINGNYFYKSPQDLLELLTEKA